MTLLELLLQELPKRGGWPEGANQCVQDFSSVVKFFDSDNLRFNDTRWAGSPRGSFLCTDWNKIHGLTLSNDYATAIVTREQYEWDGTGLPPVGCTCESSWAGDEWQLCEILFASNQFIVVKLKESGMEDAYSIGDVTFRPLRTEAERAIDEMVRLSGVSVGAAKILYDAGYRKG